MPMLETILNLLQWPALVLAIAGAPLVASGVSRRVYVGFTLWTVSNLCWIAWALTTGTWSVLLMQVYFLFTSLAGRRNNRRGYITGQA